MKFKDKPQYMASIVLLLALVACQSAPAVPAVTTLLPPTPIPGGPLPTQGAPASPSQPIVPPPPADSMNLAVSRQQRQTAPQASTADQATLAGDNNTFALDLYHALPGSTPQNLVFAPISISQALAMTYAGAGGQTAQQMSQVLHFSLPPQRLHPAFNALDLSLHPATTAASADQFQLNIANSLWGQAGFPFLSGFLDTLAENYGAGMRLTDYINAPEPSRQAINQWVSQQTQNKINDLLPQGVLTPDTRLTLVNAIYFYGRWAHPFDHNLTKPADFTRLDGSKVSVAMMSPGDVASFKYVRGTNYQALELPYKGDLAAMTLILPDEGHFGEIQKNMTAAWLNDCWAQMSPKQAQLLLPRFKFETSLGLSDILGKMGMPDAIDAHAADFSGMDGRRDLFIGAVIHKALIAVDEDGTEAAAATAVGMKAMGMPMIEVRMTVDRPFFFVIHDLHNHSILFMGQVIDPH